MIVLWLLVLVPGAAGLILLCAGRHVNRVAGLLAVAAAAAVAALLALGGGAGAVSKRIADPQGDVGTVPGFWPG